MYPNKNKKRQKQKQKKTKKSIKNEVYSSTHIFAVCIAHDRPRMY